VSPMTEFISHSPIKNCNIKLHSSQDYTNRLLTSGVGKDLRFEDKDKDLRSEDKDKDF